MRVKKIIIYVAVCIILISTSFFAGAITTKCRLMEQHRMELELSRQRASVLTDTLTRAREEVGEIGASLGRQRTSVAELRSLIAEVRARYEKMEELLNGIGDNDSDIRSSGIYTDSSNGE